MELRFLNSHDIDFNKWDACAEHYGDGLPYANSWVLNCLHANWGGVVFNDYQAILPLPFTQKIGLRFGIQSPWIQQLGVFADKDLAFEIIEKMWQLASEHLQLIHYKCHTTNPKKINGFKVKEWQNLVLHLNKSYDDLSANFNSNTKRNIKKTSKANLITRNIDDSELLINTYLNYQLEKIDGLKAKHLNPMQQLIKLALEKKYGFIKAAYNINGEFLGGCFYLTSGKRIVHLLPALTEKGRQQGAMFGIINNVINEFTTTNKVLDFEGSMVEGIAKFYRGFGAESETYYEYYKENMKPLTQLAWRVYKGFKG